MKTTINNGFSIWLDNVNAYRVIDTFKYYERKAKNLMEFFKTTNLKYFEDINDNIFDKLIGYFKNKNLSNNSINKLITVLKICINFLNERKLIKLSVPSNIKLPETQPKIEIIETEVLNTILKYLEEQNNNNLYLCFMLMLTTGIRRTEITRIKVKNVDLNNNQIYLDETKNHKPRVIYIINSKIKELIEKNLNLCNNQQYLLYSNKTKSYTTPNTISSYFTKIKKDLKLKTLSPHKLRHTYATMLINNGADMNSVRILLGHDTLYMTQRYIQMNNQQLKEINNKFNPLTNLI